MTEQIFWQIIESAWTDFPSLNQQRLQAVEDNDEEALQELSEALENEVFDSFKHKIRELNQENLTKFIHILEEKIYNIDRAEIQEYTDGSDDGFLYCRCFILAMGQAYYDMIDNSPEKASMDLEAESFVFSIYKVYEEKYGEAFDLYATHCMETGSNHKGWLTE